MKKFEKIINTKFTLFSLLFLLLNFPLARGDESFAVLEVKGRVFGMGKNRSWELKEGDSLQKSMEIMTEEGGQVSLQGESGFRFHLSGSGQLKIFDKSLELLGGYLWIQSLGRINISSVTTANAAIQVNLGEAIISFDNGKGKSQILVINGNFDFSNLMNKEAVVHLRTGQFSFVDNEYDSGIPRAATPIGQSSYNKIISLFENIQPYKEGDQVPLTLASHPAPVVEHAAVSKNVEGKKAVIKKQMATSEPLHKRERLGVQDLQTLYEAKLPTQKAKGKMNGLKSSLYLTGKRSGTKIKVYGMGFSKGSEKGQEEPGPFNDSISQSSRLINPTRGRAPASLIAKRQPSSHGQSGKRRPVDQATEASSINDYKNQMRPKDEVNQLIHDLESYQQDYKVEY